MSAPTRAAEWKDDGIWHTITPWAQTVYRKPTPADVRLWLLDQGAREVEWCEVHQTRAASAMTCDRPTSSACRMVSVLVYKP